ncbi:MAG TPA: hypothetical protein VF062_10860, partial [Candidatus Limnocylindrales bacterium]
PFGTCDNEGVTQYALRPADGFGSVTTLDGVTVLGHPGIFSVGDAPVGKHYDGHTGEPTALSRCNELLPLQSSACRVRTNSDPASLEVDVTGAEAFICNPCNEAAILFELAPVVNDVVGQYAAQSLGSLMSAGPGVERAFMTLRDDTPPGGEFRFRVRFPAAPEFPAPLTVELGPPT